MNAKKLLWSDYVSSDMESSGSFFTSEKYLPVEHSHDFYEFCFITEGKIIHIINGKKQLLSPGSFIFVRPDDVHYFEVISSDYFQYINLAVHPKAIHDMLDYLGEGFKPERFLDSPDAMYVDIPKPEIEFVKSKLEYFILSQHCDDIHIKSDLRSTLVYLMTQYFPVKLWEKKTSVPVWLDWLYKEMQKKDNFIGGIAMMQKLACKSPEHLSREFRKHYQMTPTDFINSTKLDYAKNLLIYSDEKIIDIAYSSGFPNLSHFCHEYKKKYGISPSSYRNQYLKLIRS